MHPTAAQLARNVYEILSKLPRHGVGSKLSRKTWMKNSFWKVTDVKMETTGKNGKAYGLLTWRGLQGAEKPVRINGSYKKVWRQLDVETTSSPSKGGWPSLALAALKQESAAAAASTADTEAPSERAEEAEEGSSSSKTEL